MSKIINKGYGAFPLLDLIFILAIGLVSLIISLVIFDNPFRQKKEFK